MDDLTPEELESVRRVVDIMDDHADIAPSSRMAALWRRLAANTRRELIAPSPGLAELAPVVPLPLPITDGVSSIRATVAL